MLAEKRIKQWAICTTGSIKRERICSRLQSRVSIKINIYIYIFRKFGSLSQTHYLSHNVKRVCMFVFYSHNSVKCRNQKVNTVLYIIYLNKILFIIMVRSKPFMSFGHHWDKWEWALVGSNCFLHQIQPNNDSNKL